MNNEIQKSSNINKSLISISELFRASWRIYKNRFRTLILISLLPFIFTVLSRIAYIFENNVFWTVADFIALISFFIFYLLAMLALIYALYNESLGVVTAYKIALSNFKSFLWLTIITFFISLGGFIMGIIPAFIFTIWFVFASYIFVEQDLRGLQALLKSKEYVTGYFWKIFWRLFIVIGIYFLIIVLLYFINENTIGMGTEDVYIIHSIFDILFLPFSVVYFFVLYRSLVSFKPELFGQLVKTKKGFFVFAGKLGIVIAIVLLTLILIGFFLI